MLTKKLFLFGILSILVIASLALAACTPATTTPGANVPATQPIAQGPVVGGTLVIGLETECDTLDPHKTAMSSSDMILSNIGIALIAKDADNNYVPWAAESWQGSADGLTWTFNLRHDMKFSDGTPLDAKDYAFTYQRALDLGSQGGAAGQLIPGITNIETPDDYTLKLTLSEANFYFLDNLTSAGYLQPMSQAWVESQGENLGRSPMSAGPYKIKEWVTGDHVSIERNPDYTWAPAYAHQGPAYIQEITYRFIPEASTIVAGLEAGDIDYIVNLGVQFVDEVKATGKFDILQSAYMGTNPFITMNVKQWPFDDMKVRQAFGYAIDRQALIDVVLQGQGTIQYGPISQSMTGYWPGIEQIGYTLNVEKAKALLAEDGYTANADGIMEKDGKPLSLDFYGMPGAIKDAQVIKEQLKAIGVELNIVQQEAAVLIGNIMGGTYQISLLDFGYPNADILAMIFHSRQEGAMNLAHVSDPGLDTQLDLMRNSTDPAVQQQAANEAQRIVIEKAYMLPLYNPTAFSAISKRILGYTFSAKNTILYLHDAYIQP